MQKFNQRLKVKHVTCYFVLILCYKLINMLTLKRSMGLFDY